MPNLLEKLCYLTINKIVFIFFLLTPALLINIKTYIFQYEVKTAFYGKGFVKFSIYKVAATSLQTAIFDQIRFLAQAPYFFKNMQIFWQFLALRKIAILFSSFWSTKHCQNSLKVLYNFRQKIFCAKHYVFKHLTPKCQ